MAAGSATAADVPGKYDCVINGFGYCLLDSLEESIPFRTHRAVYGFTPPFVERQNVSNSYGDNTQDFFLTIRQRDWSLGEQQKFFRSTSDGRYWMGSAVDVSTPGQVTMRRNATATSFGTSIISAAPLDATHDTISAVSSTNLYDVDSTGTVTDRGAHGLGAAPSVAAVVSDGNAFFLSTTTAGTVGVRRYDGITHLFSTFSATGADALAYLNNTLYGLRINSGFDLIQYDTTGTVTSLFTWKDSAGTGVSSTNARLEPYGSKLLILKQRGTRTSELWIYDGTGVTRLLEFPPSFQAWDLEVVFGVAFISGRYVRKNGSNLEYKPAVFFFDGSQTGILWKANGYSTTDIDASLVAFDDGLVFNDDTTPSLMFYNPATGGVSSIGSYSVTGSNPVLAGTSSFFLLSRNSTTGYFAPDPSTVPTSSFVVSSLIDFDSSLKKVFRGITVEFSAASDGDGGSVDVSYQLDSVSGSFTSLATGVTSGVEIPLPANTDGHAITVKVTLNKGTSTSGPTLKSYSLRGAPQMPQYPRAELILDCTNTEESPRQLRDDSYHPLTGYSQVQNLVAAAKSTTPISITDKMNGTYTGFIDINDPQGFDVYEIHPAEDDLKKAGSYVVRLTARAV